MGRGPGGPGLDPNTLYICMKLSRNKYKYLKKGKEKAVLKMHMGL